MEIAVFAGRDGLTASIQEAGEIQVYQYYCGKWDMCRSMPFHLHAAKELQGMREHMKTVLHFLGECRTFIGLSVNGLPFFELEKAGFTVWEAEGLPAEVLDGVLEEEKKLIAAAEETAEAVIIPEPMEISPGYYSISLKDIQNYSGKVTSKQLLIPLLQKMDFINLEIICSHVPPWLEEQILSGQLEARVNKLSSFESRVNITGKSAFCS